MAMYTTPKLYTEPKYVDPAYNEAKYRAGIDTSYYTKAINDFNTQAEKQRQTQIGEAGKTRDSALKQAYIQRAQNQRQLNDNLTRSGIRGGATETSNLRLANQYGTAVSAANSDYSNSVNSINQAIDKNKADYASDMNSRAEEYRQNLSQARWQADREASLARWNSQRERLQANWQAQREDALNQYNAQNEYWNNFYLDYYSGASQKSLDDALKQAQKDLRNAKTAAERTRIQQRIRGIQNRRGVLANQK